ncbi:nicotinate-nucleotide adenylyltransferase [Sagittula marina]|uniref:Probable nicotinate-nucleotide adenylyltransferase n=1 Tax=Sagittula marina TaxID=943940 RepID=A0A7W6GRQ6_9RHOB|nr:nicotinate-nucleotide adenylyltransferase [Sagittula marina]
MDRSKAGVAFRPGAKVGLLGGSFDPPHAGHVHLSREALKRFGLDSIVWLVSPGNPLKPKAPASLKARIAAAEAMTDHPRIHVSGIEADIGTRYTAETLTALTSHFSAVRFCWLMGADNLAQFHRWEDWRGIAARVPIGVLARPEVRTVALSSVAARIMRASRVPAAQSHRLAAASAPAWCFVNIPMRKESSTELRAKGAWGASHAAKT